ncbi:hypothetical protein [Pseudoalteromonas spongiae]|uniref:hypothetical protein n=1 Tax=Pseudoalteromonas spongiae TaxID=298657 RepID=UPI000C2D1949|nr:hypothetical protein [Pseudoalteromonas spongiae]
MDIKKLRKELKVWGVFWRNHESVGGYASKSNVDRIREVCELGGWCSSDLHLFDSASSIHAPEHIQITTALIDRLKTPYKIAIMAWYTKRLRGDEFASYTKAKSKRDGELLLMHAENALLVMVG